jgi:hypothetical protein
MKVTVEVDCTPLEARQFFGLPDVQPMQQAIMVEMEKNIMKEAQRYTPEALVQTWFASIPQSADWFRDVFSKMIATTGTGLATPGMKKPPADPKP